VQILFLATQQSHRHFANVAVLTVTLLGGSG
jgi:hypothetical protein